MKKAILFFCLTVFLLPAVCSQAESIPFEFASECAAQMEENTQDSLCMEAALLYAAGLRGSGELSDPYLACDAASSRFVYLDNGGDPELTVFFGNGRYSVVWNRSADTLDVSCRSAGQTYTQESADAEMKDAGASVLDDTAFTQCMISVLGEFSQQ